MTISSPCRNICVLDDGSGLCLGCGRTLDEIARWASFSEEQRLAIMAVLPGRLTTWTKLNSIALPPASTDDPRDLT